MVLGWKHLDVPGRVVGFADSLGGEQSPICNAPLALAQLPRPP
jgi:hypothetical protein